MLSGFELYARWVPLKNVISLNYLIGTVLLVYNKTTSVWNASASNHQIAFFVLYALPSEEKNNLRLFQRSDPVGGLRK